MAFEFERPVCVAQIRLMCCDGSAAPKLWCLQVSNDDENYMDVGDLQSFDLTSEEWVGQGLKSSFEHIPVANDIDGGCNTFVVNPQNIEAYIWRLFFIEITGSQTAGTSGDTLIIDRCEFFA